MEAGGVEGDGQSDFGAVRHPGVRVGNVLEGGVYLVKGGHGAVGVAGAQIVVGNGGPLIVVGHQDHPVANLPQGPVVKAFEPGVGLDTDKKGLILRQSGPQVGHKGGKAFPMLLPQSLKVDGKAGVRGCRLGQKGDGFRLLLRRDQSGKGGSRAKYAEITGDIPL